MSYFSNLIGCEFQILFDYLPIQSVLYIIASPHATQCDRKSAKFIDGPFEFESQLRCDVGQNITSLNPTWTKKT